MGKAIKVEIFNPVFLENKTDSLFICAGGFEDRVLGIVKQLKEKRFAYSVVFEYTAQKEDNKPNLLALRDSLKELSCKEPLVSFADPDNPLKTQQNLVQSLKGINKKEINHVFIDISGMTNSLILQTLSDANKLFWDKNRYIFYTEAEDYYPMKEEIKKIYKAIKNEDIETLGAIFSSAGAKETFVLPDFQGKFKDYLPICLIFFVGYEPIRSKGLIEQYCPNIVVVCYTESPHIKFKWRTNFSRKIHKKVFEKYNHIDSKTINKQDFSSFEITSILKELKRIYNAFYEDYNICVTPQCSKIQAVATYLFTLTHADVQILFCLPGTFNPKKYSRGIGTSHIVELENI